MSTRHRVLVCFFAGLLPVLPACEHARFAERATPAVPTSTSLVTPYESPPPQGSPTMAMPSTMATTSELSSAESERPSSFQGLKLGRRASSHPRRLAQAGSAGAMSASSALSPAADTGEKRVVTGTVSYVAEDIGVAVAHVRAQVSRFEGIITGDRFSGDGDDARWELAVRLFPGSVEGFLSALDGVGHLVSRDLNAQEISREFFDQELRLRTLRVTGERLEKLLAQRTDAPLADVLAIEREMQRVRGEIEQLEGQHRYLSDRIERATIGVIVSSHVPVSPGLPRKSFLLVPRAQAWHFLDAREGRHQDRFGFGLSLLFGDRFDFTLDVLPTRGADARSYLASAGVSLYSDFLGGGRRRFFNPYLSARAGFGDLNDRTTYALGAEAGIELVQTRFLLIDLAGRIYGIRYGEREGASSNDVATQINLGVGVPF